MSDTNSGGRNPVVPLFPVDSDGIPELMKGLDRWVVWCVVPKAKGKFDKVPTDPATGRHLTWSDPSTWTSFDDAYAAYKKGGYGGVGIVLSDKHPIQFDGHEMYLVALDYDGLTKEDGDATEEEWLGLGKPYVEISPGGRGLHMFALTSEPLKGGNNGRGREMYISGRFMTVTGQKAKGSIKDATGPLRDMKQLWFPDRSASPKFDLKPNESPPEMPETEEHVNLVKGALNTISPDCSRDEKWRNIIWSVMSTGWDCAVDLVREWSKSVEEIDGHTHHYEDDAFDNIVNSFDPTRGISLGTLFHHAKIAGWEHPSATVTPEARHIPPESFSTQLRGLLTPEEVKSLPSEPYRVRGLLPRRGLAAVYGKSGSGKSFLVIDLIFAIAAGRDDWFGFKLKQASVAYVGLEGRGGIAKRIKAWEAHHDEPAPTEGRIWLEDFTLLDKANVDRLAREIANNLGKGGVVVVDTLNQAAPGADENSSADMGKILGNAKRLADRMEGLVILIHHSGKDTNRGLRGHSSLIAALDSAIEVTNKDTYRSWKVIKAKDDVGGVTRDFDLKPYTVEHDEDGLEVTSCAIMQTLQTVIPKVKPPKGKNQKPCMEIMEGLCFARPLGVSEEEAVDAVAAALDTDRGRSKTVAKDTIRALIDRGNLHQDDEGLISVARNSPKSTENQTP